MTNGRQTERAYNRFILSIDETKQGISEAGDKITMGAFIIVIIILILVALARFFMMMTGWSPTINV